MRSAYDPAFRQAGANAVYTVLPGTTDIAPRAFARCAGIRAIELPDSLQNIGERAFWDCTALTSLSPLTGVSLGAFALQCTPLEGVLN